MGSKLDLPLVGRDWRISLPLEQWGNLTQACTDLVEVLGGINSPEVERLDFVLRQALAAAEARPPEEAG